MARSTDVSCDAAGCGYTDGAKGGTDWLIVKRAKRSYDFCSERCLTAWAQALPTQGRLEEAVAR